MLFSDVKALLRTRHGDEAVQKCLAEIDNVFLTTLQSVQPTMSCDRRCFELYGYDILLDTDLKPWLIEVHIPTHSCFLCARNCSHHGSRTKASLPSSSFVPPSISLTPLVSVGHLSEVLHRS